jgi:hypothetical protein
MKCGEHNQLGNLDDLIAAFRYGKRRPTGNPNAIGFMY